MFQDRLSVQTIRNQTALSGLLPIVNEWDEGEEIRPFMTQAGEMRPVLARAWRPGVCGQIIAWRLGGFTVVSCDGIGGQQDGMQVYRGWLSPERMGRWGGWHNAYAKLWYENSIEYIRSLTTPGMNDWLFVGHSWGSTTATYFARHVRDFLPDAKIRLATFGAPRFTTTAFLNELRVQEWSRTQNAGDIIPFVAPYVAEAPVFMMLHTPQQVANLTMFQHMSHGIQISRTEFKHYEYDTSMAIPLELTIPSLIRDLNGFGGPHDVRQYHARLMNLFNMENPRVHEMPPPPIVELPLRVHGRADANNPSAFIQPITTREAEAVIAEQVAARRNTRDPLLPLKFDPSPTAKKVRIVKVKNRYSVTVGGNTVYLASSRRDAKGFARAMRQAQIQLQQRPEGLVDPESLTSHLLGLIPGTL